MNLGEINFYWRMKDSGAEEKTAIPQFLPFEFDFWPQQQLVIQKRNPRVLEVLEQVYELDSNVGYLQEGQTHANSYGNEFFDFISRHLSELPQNGSVTEIGCGGCFLLKKLKDIGFNVQGVDPSPVAERSGKKLAIKIIKDFFPSKKLIDKQDMILHYDVLEHIDDPKTFLVEQNRALSQRGIVVFAVPDCTEYIENGDISMILHEHLNYFQVDSLQLLVEQSGFQVLEIARSKHGGVLFCAARRSPSVTESFILESSRDKFLRFKSKNASLTGNLISCLAKSDSWGFYVPLRISPYICQIKNKSFKFRFFDDDPSIHRKSFDGFNVPIENFEDLLKEPVPFILIGSFSFGDQIKAKVLSALPNIKAITLKEVADGQF